MDDPIRRGIQAILDNCPDGFSVTYYVVGMLIERVQDGELQCEPWLWAPPHQPACMSRAVVNQTYSMQPSSEGMDDTA